jgi:hypothetical protein
MDFRAFRLLLRFAVSLTIGGSLLFAAPSGPPGKKQEDSSIQEARSFGQAMEWFKKAEALIGTPKENSEEQAELFKKAIEIMPDIHLPKKNKGSGGSI